jgi:hypothetical protein
MIVPLRHGRSAIDLGRAAKTPLATQIHLAVCDALETDRLDLEAKHPSWRGMA